MIIRSVLEKFRITVGLCISCQHWDTYPGCRSGQMEAEGNCRNAFSPFSNVATTDSCLYWEERIESP